MTEFSDHLQSVRAAKLWEERKIMSMRKMFIDASHLNAEANLAERFHPEKTYSYDVVETFQSKAEAYRHLRTRSVNAMGDKMPIVRKKRFKGRHIAIVVDPLTGIEQTLHATRGWLVTGKRPMATAPSGLREIL